MIQYFNKKHRGLALSKLKGFTLIELLVVIAIIGILATIILVSLSGTRGKSRDAQRQSDINQIYLAMELYYDDGQAYLTTSTMPTAIGTHLPTVPKDPLNSGGHVYGWFTNVGDNQKYCAWAVLESNNVFTASKNGTKMLTGTATPTSLNCGW